MGPKPQNVSRDKNFSLFITV